MHLKLDERDSTGDQRGTEELLEELEVSRLLPQPARRAWTLLDNYEEHDHLSFHAYTLTHRG